MIQTSPWPFLPKNLYLHLCLNTDQSLPILPVLQKGSIALKASYLPVSMITTENCSNFVTVDDSGTASAKCVPYFDITDEKKYFDMDSVPDDGKQSG